ncbi:MAG: hypothetical protein AAGI08_00070 [Bacteroidota bacterium]
MMIQGPEIRAGQLVRLPSWSYPLRVTGVEHEGSMTWLVGEFVGEGAPEGRRERVILPDMYVELAPDAGAGEVPA